MEDIKEKTADKMFEELGYVKSLTKQVAYLKNNNTEFILFINDKKGVCIHKEGTEYPAFTMQELQAINKKCKELKWI